MGKNTSLEIIEKIGEGGMGEVYLGLLSNDNGFKKQVACKKILSYLKPEDKEERLLLLQNEANLLAKLTHPNICQILDIRELDGSVYLVLEYIEGLTLSNLIELVYKRNAILNSDVILEIGLQIAKALEFAHTLDFPILHRDISPHNLMLDKFGSVKVLDFGLGKVEELTQISNNEEATFGKLRYCAPEIYDGDKYSIQSEMFSLGIVLYELALGEKTYAGLSTSEIIKNIKSFTIDEEMLINRKYSQQFITFLIKLTNTDKKRRVQNTAELITEINLIKKRFCDLSFELKNILDLSLDDKTKTVHTTQTKKTKKNKLILQVAITLLIFGIIAYFKYSGNERYNKLQINVIINEKENQLSDFNSKNEVGSELGYTLNQSSCFEYLKTVFSLPAMLVMSNTEGVIKSKGIVTNPNSLLTTIINQHVSEYETYLAVKKMCQHNTEFNLISKIYDEIFETTSSLKPQIFNNYNELRSNFLKTVSYTDEKYLNFLKYTDQILTSDQRADLEMKMSDFKIADLKSTVGYKLVGLSEDKFPKSLYQCSSLLDFYWVKQITKINKSNLNYEDEAILLYPFPLQAEINKYDRNIITFLDSGKLNNSKFKTKGVCVYRRIKGELKEISLRRL